METPRLTLADVIAAGGRLLADGPARSEHDAPPVEVPDTERAAAPAPTGDWRSAAEIAQLTRCDPWTVAEHLRNGTLHGHVESTQWWVRGPVAAAFLAGLDVAAQQRACGCRTLRLVHGSRRDPTSCEPPRRRPSGSALLLTRRATTSTIGS